MDEYDRVEALRKKIGTQGKIILDCYEEAKNLGLKLISLDLAVAAGDLIKIKTSLDNAIRAAKKETQAWARDIRNPGEK